MLAKKNKKIKSRDKTNNIEGGQKNMNTKQKKEPRTNVARERRRGDRPPSNV
jgi:hypothetical protein